MIQQERPDRVLLEVKTPGFNSAQVAQVIQSDPILTSVKIIVMTNDGPAETLRASGVAGARHDLLKPFRPVVLRRLVDELRSNERPTA